MDTGEQIEITENFESMAGKPCYPRLSEGGLVYFEDMYDIYLTSPKGGELWVCDYSDFFQ